MVYIAITIDTEGHKGMNPIENLVYGKYQGKKYGIDLIMDICDRYQLKCIFFVDVAAAFSFGEEKVGNILRHIIERGHSAQLHIHPDHAADKERLFLSEYDKEEQREILQKCIDVYIKYTGVPPFAFRAGKYGANEETLELLKSFGIKLDFSYFYAQKWCGIKKNLGINAVSNLSQELIEIPVTVYESLRFGSKKRYDKVDINGLIFPEFKMLMRKAKKMREDVLIVFFMHSFSFLNRADNDNQISSKQSEIKRFEKICEFIAKDQSIEVLDLNQLYKQVQTNQDFRKESMIQNNNIFSMMLYTFFRAKKIVKTNRKAQLFFGIMITGALLLCVLLYVLWRGLL